MANVKTLLCTLQHPYTENVMTNSVRKTYILFYTLVALSNIDMMKRQCNEETSWYNDCQETQPASQPVSHD